MRIQMHAPAGTARLILKAGPKFGRVACYPSGIPQCQIVKFTDTELVVQNTKSDGDGVPGHFGIDVDLLVEPFGAGEVVGQTTGAATLTVTLDGVTKTLGTNQPETRLFGWFGILSDLTKIDEK